MLHDMSHTLQNGITGGELAPGWRVEVKTRNSGTSAGTNDAVSLRPACVLRSMHCRTCAENATLDNYACLLMMLLCCKQQLHWLASDTAHFQCSTTSIPLGKGSDHVRMLFGTLRQQQAKPKCYPEAKQLLMLGLQKT